MIEYRIASIFQCHSENISPYSRHDVVVKDYSWKQEKFMIIDYDDNSIFQVILIDYIWKYFLVIDYFLLQRIITQFLILRRVGYDIN